MKARHHPLNTIPIMEPVNSYPNPNAIKTSPLAPLLHTAEIIETRVDLLHHVLCKALQ